jgi:hypothetical protein
MNDEQVVAAVVQCGVSSSHVRIRHDERLQLDMIIIDRLRATPSEPVLTCIYKAAVPAGYYVAFSDTGQHAVFWSVASGLERQDARRDAQQWLQAHGLLEGLPVYKSGGSTPEGFAREVEKHCSLEPGSAIEVIGPTAFTLRQDFMPLASVQSDNEDKFICLMNVLAVSDIQFGFIGNEAVRPKGHRR